MFNSPRYRVVEKMIRQIEIKMEIQGLEEEAFDAEVILVKATYFFVNAKNIRFKPL